MAKYSLNDMALSCLLLLSVVYNTQMSPLRVSYILLFLLFGVILMATKSRYNIRRSHYHIRLSATLWISYIVYWVAQNYDNLAVNLQGANVEMLTPILFVSLIYIIPLIDNYDHRRLNKCVTQFVNSYVLYLLFDVLYRLYLEPGCFLNYTCRFAAKTVGLFSTTNALASSLVVVIIALIMFGRKFKVQIAILMIIMITTMARAAIVGFIIGLAVYLFTKLSKKIKIFYTFILLLTILLLIYFDPLAFRGDGSMLSKIDFIIAALALAKSYDMNTLIFGFGTTFDKIVEVLGVNGWSPHLPILKSFLYFGIIGASLYVYHIISLVRLAPGASFAVLGFIVLSLAGAPIFFPSFIALFAILKAKSISDSNSTHDWQSKDLAHYAKPSYR
jgi:hypothetical protein